MEDPEVKTVQQTEGTDEVNLIDHLSKFSSWSRAVRAVVRLMRRVNKDKSSHLSTTSERQKAELHIIKCLQSHVYKDEFQ